MRAIARMGSLATVALTLPSAASGQERFADPRPTSEQLWPVANAVAEASGEIGSIWPDFWSADDGFLLMSPHGGMLLMVPWEASDPFVIVDTVAEYRVYEAEGGLPEYSGGRFPGTYELGGRRVYALPPMGRSLFNRIAFYVHEAFHFFQRGDGGWTETPEDSIMGLSPEKYLSDPSVVSSPAFAAALAIEDSLLLEIASAKELQLTRRLLGDYIAARSLRSEGYPDVAAVERRYERREGTAEYVGCLAAVAATGGGSEELTACMTEELKEESKEIMQLIRWRLYSSGAVISAALDRLGTEGWKDAVASGTRLDEIITAEIGSF